MIDRTEVNRALSKALAFKACGKDRDAERWARELVRLLGCAGILALEDERYQRAAVSRYSAARLDEHADVDMAPHAFRASPDFSDVCNTCGESEASHDAGGAS